MGASSTRNLSPLPWWVRLCNWLWTQRSFLWITFILGIGLNLFAAWLLTPVGSIDYNKTPLGIAWRTPIWFFVGGTALVMCTFLTFLVARQYGRGTVSSLWVPSLQERSQLIQLLQHIYRREQSIISRGMQRLPLHLCERLDALSNSLPVPMYTPRYLPAHTTILNAYDEAVSGLLLLGPAGSGKTTCLRELAQQLLMRARNNTELPIPVILNLSSWTNSKASLDVWVIEELLIKYRLPSAFGSAWLQKKQLLLLLDGFDDVEESSRSACVTAINAYHTKQFTPLVVCSRSHTYFNQGARLTLPYAVEIQSLTHDEVNAYLLYLGSSMAAVRHAVLINQTLADLLTTPLMLQIVTQTYENKHVGDLPKFGSVEEQQYQILQQYTIAMLNDHAHRRHYSVQQTRKWLIWLAKGMRNHQISEMYLEQLQASWLITRQSQIAYTWLVSFGRLAYQFFVYALLGLSLILVFILHGEFTVVSLILRSIPALLIFTLVPWLLSLLLGKVLSGSKVKTAPLNLKPFEIHPSEVLSWSWKGAWRNTWPMVVGVMLALPIIELSSWLSLFLFSRTDLQIALLIALFLVPFRFLTGGYSEKRLPNQKRMLPNQGIHRSGWNALLMGSLIGLSLGACASLLLWLSLGPRFWVVGIPICLLLGSIVALNYGGKAYLEHYILRFFLWQNSATPWHYIRFLNEATDRQLLQREGGGYKFIYPLLHDFFTSLNPTFPYDTQRDEK